jgi:DNA-binding GntR family transcriptional regulator
MRHAPFRRTEAQGDRHVLHSYPARCHIMTQSQADTNLRSRAYDEIRRRILASELPPGSALSEYQLSAALSISRTPIREALRRLEREGLVVAIGQRGTVVAQLSARDIMEIYQVREQLEAFAVRVAAERIAPEAELTQAMASLADTPELALKADFHLHKQLVAVTQNQRMQQILGTLDDQVHIIRNMAASSVGRLQQMTREHLEIIGAIRAGDAEGADDAMRRHLRSARDHASRLVLPAP